MNYLTAANEWAKDSIRLITNWYQTTIIYFIFYGKKRKCKMSKKVLTALTMVILFMMCFLSISDTAEACKHPKYVCPPLCVKVVYCPNGGIGSPQVDYVKKGSQYTIKDQGYKHPNANYIFVGWNTKPNGRGVHFSVGQVITVKCCLILYAQYAPGPQISVVYHPNGGIGETRTDNVFAGAPYTIKNQGYTREGYVFSHWNTRADNLGINFSVGQVIYPQVTLVLYAQWTRNQSATLTVTYDPNGGNGVIVQVPVVPNTYHTVQDQGYTYDEGTFLGYNTRADGLGINYRVGDRIFVDRNITLYAYYMTSNKWP